QLGAVLNVLDTAHVDAHRSVELERTAAGGDFGVTVDYADLFTQLVDKNGHAVGLCDRACQLTHGLAHHAGMQADKRVAHFALDLLTGYERCDRVHDHDVQCTRAHQCFGDFQTLLTGIRL